MKKKDLKSIQDKRNEKKIDLKETFLMNFKKKFSYFFLRCSNDDNIKKYPQKCLKVRSRSRKQSDNKRVNFVQS